MKKLETVLFVAAIATNALAVGVSREQVLSGPLGNVVSFSQTPSAVWTGDDFAVFWVEGTDVRATRIAVNGRILEPARVVWSGVQGQIDAKSDGTTITVVGTSAGQSLVVAQEFTFNLVPLGDTLRLGPGLRPKIFFDGTTWLAGWFVGPHDRVKPVGDLLLSRFDRSFALISERVFSAVPTARMFDWDLAMNGTDALLVWADAIGCEQPTMDLCLMTSRLRGARIAADLTSLDLNGINVAPAGWYPEVHWIGNQYFVLWSDLRQIFASHVDTMGNVLEWWQASRPIVGSNDSLCFNASGASTGQRLLVAADAGPMADRTSGILGAEVAPDASVVGQPFWIYRANAYSTAPRTFAGSVGIALVTYNRYLNPVTYDFRHFLVVVDVNAQPRRDRAARR